MVEFKSDQDHDHVKHIFSFSFEQMPWHSGILSQAPGERLQGDLSYERISNSAEQRKWVEQRKGAYRWNIRVACKLAQGINNLTIIWTSMISRERTGETEAMKTCSTQKDNPR